MRPSRGRLTRNPEKRSREGFAQTGNLTDNPNLFSVSLLDVEGAGKRDTGESNDSHKTRHR